MHTFFKNWPEEIIFMIFLWFILPSENKQTSNTCKQTIKPTKKPVFSSFSFYQWWWMLLGLLGVKTSSKITAKKLGLSYPKLSEIIDFNQFSFRKECIISLLPAGLLSPHKLLFFFMLKISWNPFLQPYDLMLGRILLK